MRFIKSVVSLKYDFCDLDIGCSNVSTKDEILSVCPSQPHDGSNERSIVLLVIYFCFSFFYFVMTTVVMISAFCFSSFRVFRSLLDKFCFGVVIFISASCNLTSSS